MDEVEGWGVGQRVSACCLVPGGESVDEGVQRESHGRAQGYNVGVYVPTRRILWVQPDCRVV